MSTSKAIQFLNLSAQYASIQNDVNRAIKAVFNSNAFSGGTFVEAFEQAFADYCGCRHAIGVGSGTEAVWFALLAAGVGPGDEVITVPNSFFATAEAISQCGALPVFVDVDPETLTMDPEQLEAAITPATRAIVPVHLFGQVADMEAIDAIARRHGLPVIEDAAQAHGARFQGRRAGSLGLAGCFSFYPGKNLGAPGEAGAVTTNDDAVAARIRMLRDHGQVTKHDHRAIGWNGRMDGIHGAILSAKLKHLDAWNQARRERAQAYDTQLADLTGVKVPSCVEPDRHVYHIYALRCGNRDALAQELAYGLIGAAIHYPVPIHLQPAYTHLGGRPGQFPVAEQAARELLSLPMYPELGMKDLRRVCERVVAWADRDQIRVPARKRPFTSTPAPAPARAATSPHPRGAQAAAVGQMAQVEHHG